MAVNINGSTFTNNQAGYGGSVWNHGGTSTTPATITGSTFTGNTATYGGVIRNWGVLNVTNSTFTGNSGTQGGVFNNNDNSAILNVTGSTFTNNSATYGGALYNGAGTAEIHFNRIIGNTGTDIYRSAGTVNAQNNWWGNNYSGSSPLTAGRVNNNVNATTWLVLNITASPTSIRVGGTSTATADLTHDQNGNYYNPASGHVPDGIPINFTGTLGSVSPTGSSLVNGLATTTFTAGYVPGTATVSAVVDGVTVSTPITLRPIANLEITQNVNSPVNVGNTVTYTVTVKNNGPNTAHNIKIQDIVPAGFTAVASAGTYSNGIWTINSLDNNAVATLTITGTATSSMAGLTTSNTATETSQDEEYTSPLPTSTAGVYTKKADVVLTQTTSSTPVNVGDAVTYTVTANNHGPDTATNINIRDIIPSGLTNVIVTCSAGTSYSNGIWTITSLPKDGIATLTIAGKAGADMAGLTTTNTATRTGQTEYNSQPATSTSSGIYVKKANVVITNAANSSNLNVGQTGTFTVTVTNNGPDTATNIVINDPLPSGFSASVTGGTYNNGVWTINSLASQQSVTLTFTGSITPSMAGTNIVNHATETQTEYPPATITDATIHVNKANIVVTITPSNNRPNVGQSYTYTVTVTNNGDDAATGVTVSGAVPAGLTLNDYHISMGSLTSDGWYIGTLAKDGTATLTVTVTPQSSAAGQDIVAAVTETQNEYPQTTSASSTIHVPKASVVVTNTANSSNLNVGQTGTFTITVKNNGDDTATNIQIHAPLPSGFNADIHGIGSYSNGIWTITSLAKDATATLTFTGTMTPAMAGTNITNHVTETQNEYPFTVPVSDAKIHVNKANVAISKTANNVSKAIVNVGDTIKYIITVTNNGPDTATGLKITDLVPSGLSNLEYIASTGTYSLATGLWDIGTLLNDETATLTITGKITSAMAGLTITNYANITAENEYSSLPVVSAADVYTKKANVALSQTGSYSGNKVTFIVKATNKGPDAATNINIKDLIPTGLTGTTVTPSIGTYNSSTGIWTIPSLANGAVAILNITGTATPQTTVYNNVTLLNQTEYNPNTPTTKIGVYVPKVKIYAQNYPWWWNSDIGASQYEYVVGNVPPITVDIWNLGPDDATGVIYEYDIGNGLKYEGCSVDAGIVTYDSVNNRLIWNIGNISSGGDILMKVFVRIMVSGNQTPSLTTTAKLINVDQYNTGGANSNASCALITPLGANIAINQTQTSYTNNGNQYITYTITVTNNGPDTATGVQITDKLPSGLQYTSSNTLTGTYDSNTGIWNIGTINNGTVLTLTITAKITATTGTIKNKATKTAENEYDWLTADDSQTVTFVKSGTYTSKVKIYAQNYPWWWNSDIGASQYEYVVGNVPPITVDIWNLGPDDATGVIYEYDIGNGLKYEGCSVDAGIVTYDSVNNRLIWNIGNISSGGDILMKVFVRIMVSGNQTPSLTTTAKLINVDQYNTGGANSNASCALITPLGANIAINQTQTSYTNNGNQYITYTITVTNNGPDTATGVQITDKLPSGLQYTSSNTLTGTYDSNTGIWNIGTINNGTVLTLTITAKITATTGTIKNKATKTAENEYDWLTADDSQTIVLNIP